MVQANRMVARQGKAAGGMAPAQTELAGAVGLGVFVFFVQSNATRGMG